MTILVTQKEGRRLDRKKDTLEVILHDDDEEVYRILLRIKLTLN